MPQKRLTFDSYNGSVNIPLVRCKKIQWKIYPPSLAKLHNQNNSHVNLEDFFQDLVQTFLVKGRDMIKVKRKHLGSFPWGKKTSPNSPVPNYQPPLGIYIYGGVPPHFDYSLHTKFWIPLPLPLLNHS